MTKASAQAAPATPSTPDTLAIWSYAEKTDPRFVKEFNRGGFKGTAINPTWLAKRATEIFGPIGIGWGTEIIHEEYREGGVIAQDYGAITRETIHIIKLRLWYRHPETREEGSVIQYGQTTFIGRNKNGIFTDEEAPKKTITDAMSKCLSLLGFASDVHMGMWDSSKYVNDRRQEVMAEVKARGAAKVGAGGPANAGLAAEQAQAAGEHDDRSAYEPPANDETQPGAAETPANEPEDPDEAEAARIAAHVKTLNDAKAIDAYRLQVNEFVERLRREKKRVLLASIGAAFNGRRTEIGVAA